MIPRVLIPPVLYHFNSIVQDDNPETVEAVKTFLRKAGAEL